MNNRQNLIKYFFLFFTYIFVVNMLFMTSCEEDIDNITMIKKEVDFKIKKHINKKIDNCRLNALEEAEVFVDSIITEVTLTAINKDIDFPDKPEGRDTSSSEFNIEIDSINLEDVVDSLRLKIDSVEIKTDSI